jgi:hypothetical protein
MEKIRSVEALEYPMGKSWIIDSEVANPMSIFPEYRAKRSSWMDRLTHLFFGIQLRQLRPRGVHRHARGRHRRVF